MKFLSIILTLYLLMLTVVSCGDGMEYQEGNKDEISLSQDSTTSCSDHSEDANDNCSPFCVCRCCHTHVSIPSAIEFAEASAYVQFNNHAYTDRFSTSHLNSLFRPPQV